MTFIGNKDSFKKRSLCDRYKVALKSTTNGYCKEHRRAFFGPGCPICRIQKAGSR